MANKDVRIRSWIFTWNNYEEDHVDHCKDIECQYMIFGKEVGPKNGTPHLQGYVHFKNGKTMSAVTKLFLKKARLAIARGSGESNFVYCSKDATDVFEKGVRPKQGKRTDIDGIKEIIDEGGGLLECFNADFEMTCRMYKGFEKYMQVSQKPRSEPPKVYWRWGAAGEGKTRWVYDTFTNVYSKPEEWYDCYRNQDCMLIDDYDASTIKTKELLKLTDRYPFMGKVKGSFMHVNVPNIVITCDSPPSRFWSGNDLEQISRRMTIVEVKET